MNLAPLRTGQMRVSYVAKAQPVGPHMILNRLFLIGLYYVNNELLSRSARSMAPMNLLLDFLFERQLRCIYFILNS